MAIFQDNRQILFRLKWVRGLFAFILLVLLAKVWQLSILESDRFQLMAERNHVRTIPLFAPRGLIYDREGRVLVDNVESVNLVLFRDEIDNFRQTLDFLVKGMGFDPQLLEDRVEASRSYAVFQPVVLKENLSLEEIAYFLSRQMEHPELGIVRQPRRLYRYGSLAAHVLGYVGEVSREQLDQEEFSDHRPGDIVGQFGLERSYNRLLSGRDGYRRVLVNSVGKGIQDLGASLASEGRPLRLTLDLDLQMVAEEELGDSPGAVVALDPSSGEILAMASSPAFDPNQFATRISRKEWLDLLQNPDFPLQNRNIQSTFSPGSTFKLVAALAGLERGVIDRNSEAFCAGGVTLYGRYFRCWKEGGHGRLRLREAVQQSCNVYFYLLGQRLGIDQLSLYSQRLGLGQFSGIKLQGEAHGLVPSDDWKRRVRGQPWYPGETISVSIGQGPLNVTPYQLARAAGSLATGKLPPPRLLKSDDPALATAQESVVSLDLDPENLELIRDAMWSVVNQWGTGRGAQVAGFEVCGKTGTAQTIGNQARARLSDEESARFEANAWFVGFAPKEEPEIVVAVIVQRGGGGGAVAAPIAGKVFQTYYQKRSTPAPRPLLEVASGSDEPLQLAELPVISRADFGNPHIPRIAPPDTE